MTDQGRSIALASATVLLLACLAAPLAAGPPSFSAGELLAFAGFEEKEQQKILSGEIVARNLRSAGEKDLAVIIGMLVKGRTPMEAYDALMKGRVLEQDIGMVDWGILPADPEAGDLSGITFGPDEDDEIKALVRARPGVKVNLSTAEFERIGAAAGSGRLDPGERDAVVQAFRSVLRGRYASYRNGGLEAIEPYDRGLGRDANPGRELALATGEMAALEEQFPTFHLAVTGFPGHQDPAVGQQFRWIKQRIRDRTIFVLAHVLARPHPRFPVAMERMFFVSHSFNSLQVFSGALAVDEGILVLYVNRVSTDRVTGPGSTLKKKIGRKMLRGGIVDLFEKIQAWAEKDAPEVPPAPE